MEVLWWPTLPAPRSRRSTVMSGLLPTRAAMSRISSITCATTCLVGWCS